MKVIANEGTMRLTVITLILLALTATGCFLKPATVAGLSPAPGSEADNSSSPTKLEWTPIPDATGYRVQLSPDAEFTAADESFFTPTFRFTLTDPKENPATVFWRVKPEFRPFWKKGTWSESSSVTVKHPPVAMVALKSPVPGRTYRNLAGILIEWETALPPGGGADCELFDPGTKRILWSGKATGRTAIPFSQIEGLEHGEEPIRIGFRYTIKNRFGETSAVNENCIFRLADPWLPVDLAEYLYPGCSGTAFNTIYGDRGLCLKETPCYRDKTFTSSPIKIPAGAEVEIVSDFPEILARGPGGIRLFYLPLVEIRYKNSTGFVNGENLLDLVYYEGSEPGRYRYGTNWTVEYYPDEQQNRIYVILNADFCRWAPGQETERYPLNNFTDTNDWECFVPTSLSMSDADNDGTDEAVLYGATGSYSPEGMGTYSGYGALVIRTGIGPLLLALKETFYLSESDCMGYYTWTDTDGDRIRETVIHEWIFTVGNEMDNTEENTERMVLTETWLRDTSTGVYQYVDQKYDPLSEDYYFIYMNSGEDDLVHSGGK